jgi:hypothetical protein
MRFGYSTISVFSGTFAPLNLSSPRNASWLAIGHRERDVGLAAGDQLQVVDRPARDLGGGLHAGTCFERTAAMPPPSG